MNAATVTLPEFLHIFSEDGPVSIEIHGTAGPLPLPRRFMCAEDIAWLVSTDGQKLRQSMCFDGKALTITHCRLDMQRQAVIIYTA